MSYIKKKTRVIQRSKMSVIDLINLLKKELKIPERDMDPEKTKIETDGKEIVVSWEEYLEGERD